MKRAGETTTQLRLGRERERELCMVLKSNFISESKMNTETELKVSFWMTKTALIINLVYCKEVPRLQGQRRL